MGNCFLPILAALIALAVGACNIVDAELRQAEQAVRDLQKDPDAAQFRNVKRCPTDFYVTREVNGKNSYGAYVGFRTFYANSAGAHIVGETEYADEDHYRKLCYDKAFHDAEMERMTRDAEAFVENETLARGREDEIAELEERANTLDNMANEAMDDLINED